MKSSIKDSVRGKINAAIDAMEGEFNCRDFMHLSDSKTAVLSAIADLRQEHKLHVVRRVNVGYGTVLNMYRKGPAPDTAPKEFGRYESTTVPFANADLSGWKEVSPWMFKPIDLPKGKLRVIKETR